MTPGVRLHYLDDLRSVCMLLGIFVHASILGEFGSIKWFATVSDWFRMATFFLLSGFFSMLLLRSRTVGAYLQHRLQALVVPLVTALVLLNPGTLWLVYRYWTGGGLPAFPVAFLKEFFAGALPAAGSATPWHLHLWFLISLIFFVTTTPVVAAIIRNASVAGMASRLFGRVPQTLQAVVVVLLVIFAVLAARVVNKIVIAPQLADPWLVRTTLSYWPYFILGLVLFCSPTLWERLHRYDIPAIVLAVALNAGAYLAEASGQREVIVDLLNVSGSAAARCVITFALLRFARDFMAGTGLVLGTLSRTIYTVYLFHYGIIFALAVLITTPATIDAMHYWLIAFATIAIGIALHLVVIERVALLSFLFNGKSARRRGGLAST